MIISRRVLVVLALVTRVPAAGADTDAEVQRLFREGLELRSAGRVAEACSRFAAIDRMEKHFGALLNLGDCSEELGRTATAWRAFREAQQYTAGRPHAELDLAEARAREASVARRLCRLRIVPDRETAVVRDDGELVPAAGLGTALPVDPGRHTVEARAADGRSWATTVLVAEPGQTVTVRIALAAVPAAARAGGGGTRRTVALVTGGAGVVLLGAGGVFGLRAFSRWGDAKDACPDRDACPPRALALGDDARGAATWSNVLVGAGAAAVVAAAVLWLTR